MNDDRLTEIEIKLAHNEQALAEMSEVIYAQQNLIDRLQTEFEVLRQRIGSIEAGPDGNPMDEKPPHY